MRWPWKWRRIEPLNDLRVTLFTRQGCHLCETAWSRLRAEQQRYGFLVEVIDVDTNAELKRLHGDTVPVVAVNGKVRFRGDVNTVLLRRLLRAESRGKRRS